MSHSNHMFISHRWATIHDRNRRQTCRPTDIPHSAETESWLASHESAKRTYTSSCIPAFTYSHKHPAVIQSCFLSQLLLHFLVSCSLYWSLYCGKKYFTKTSLVRLLINLNGCPLLPESLRHLNHNAMISLFTSVQ